MIVEATFQVYKNDVVGEIQHIDGRLLNDMDKHECYIVLENVSIENQESTLCIDDISVLKYVNILDILSYNKSWEFLNAGMSARILCQCNAKIKKNDLICKIIFK